MISAAFIAFCKRVSNFISIRVYKTYRQILLVGKDQQQSIPELIFVQHTLQLLASLDDTIAIVAVDNKDDTLGVLEIMPPQRSDLVLSTHIPYGELDVLIFDSLDIEA